MSGDLTVDTLVGNVELNAVSGEVAVQNHLGAVKANTVSGDVTVAGTLSRVGIDGVSANLFVDAQGIPDSIRTNTVSGDLTLRIDADAPARYKVNTVSGTLQVDGDWECTPTLVMRGASLGSNSTIVCGVTIGEWALVGAGAVVTRDVPPCAIVAGVPARVIGDVRRHKQERAHPNTLRNKAPVMAMQTGRAS